jgi:Domain of unknown function (DUF5658)
MKVSGMTIVLFLLNLVDALLTVYWVRNGFATEGNALMASLLDMGNTPFLAVKMVIGATTAIVLWRWKNLRVAQYGLTIALAVYLGVMAVHLFTGLSAFGYLSDSFLTNCAQLTENVLAFVI